MAKKADPHSAILENHTMKVFETFLQPGQKLPMHSHIPHLRLISKP